MKYGCEMALAYKAKFEGNLCQRKQGLFQKKTRLLNPPQHHKAVRSATHRLPEKPRELVSSHADLVCEVADANARRHRVLDDIKGVANLACRQLAFYLPQDWLRTPAPNQMPGQYDPYRLHKQWIADGPL
jgi:hypothetical protein